MIEIIYRVRFPGDFVMGCKSSKFHQIFVHQTDGKYEVVEGVYDSYCDQFEQPYTDYDSNTAHQFDWRNENGGKTAYYEWLLATYTEGGTTDGKKH